MKTIITYITEALRIKSGMKNISAQGEQKYLFEVYLYNRTGEEFLDLLCNTASFATSFKILSGIFSLG